MTASRRPADTQAIHTIVEQQLACAMKLLTTLERERQALLANSMEMLESVSTDKLSAANTLQALGASLEKINAGPAQMEQLIGQTGSGDPLRDSWRELLRVAAQCHEVNLANGALLDERQQQLRRKQRSLNTLTTGIYGRGGNAPVTAGRRSIASA